MRIGEVSQVDYSVLGENYSAPDLVVQLRTRPRRGITLSRDSEFHRSGMTWAVKLINISYPVAAVEALSRRLADFAFMLRDYRFASTVYDSLRRDYAQDRANRYAAAATEMYGLSQLLSHTYFLPSTPPKLPNNPFTTLQHTDISSWLEQAVATYYSSGPGGNGVALQLDALRATVLYYEAWKMIGEWRGVGQALVRAAGEAEEVAGAVIIEEAAVADTKGGKTEKGKRRRAFNLVLAARRYETAGLVSRMRKTLAVNALILVVSRRLISYQKAHSRRCLDRASAIYRSAPWTAAQDRIEYSLGRQAYASGEMGGAVQHFLHLLGKDDNGVMGSQAGPLQDMELAYEVSFPSTGCMLSIHDVADGT